MTEPPAKQTKAKRAKAAKPAEPTEYVVLVHLPIRAATKFEDFLDLPGDLGADLLNGALQEGVWLPLGTTTTKGEKNAIDAVVGEATGTFKAVARRSWKGGEKRAQTSMIAREPLDES